METLNSGARNYWGRLTGLKIMVIVFISGAAPLHGQTSYVVGSGSQITVSGTSTLHDWTMSAGTFDLGGSFLLKNGELLDVSSLTFSLAVTNLKSKESAMDKKAYKALEWEKYPRITFKLTGATVLSQQKIIKVTGTLSIAGKSNEVSLQSGYVLNADETITCKLSRPLKMTDFNVKPPTFMMGAIKTGDAITIDIHLKLKKGTLTAQSN